MSFPTSPEANYITISSITPSFTSITQNLKRQVRSRGGQRWAISATYPPMSRATFAPLWAFAQKQKGQYGSFTYVPPLYGDSSGSATGTYRVNNGAGYAVGISTIACDGLTGTLKAGDFIKFAGHDKVYSITADATTSLVIEPPLLSAVVDDEVITYNSVPFTVAFINDTQEMKTTVDGFITYQISLVEVV
jgi:hypothetical protein